MVMVALEYRAWKCQHKCVSCYNEILLSGDGNEKIVVDGNAGIIIDSYEVNVISQCSACGNLVLQTISGRYFRTSLRGNMSRIFHELTYTTSVNQKSWLERDSNLHLLVTGPLLYQLSYRDNWEQCTRFITDIER